MHHTQDLHMVTREIRYTGDASLTFAQLGGLEERDAVLLESADISSKEGLQSVAVLRAALRLTCEGDTVVIEPLTATGQYLAQRLQEPLAQFAVGENTYRFPRNEAADERERLIAPSSILPLRLLRDMEFPGIDREARMPFIAGGFAFDYLDSFEALPPVGEGNNTYPDYQFVAAEVLLEIDHQQQSARLSGIGVEQSELSSTLEAMAAQAETTPPEHDDVVSEAQVLQARANISDADFRAHVEKLKGNIYTGDIYQVVPARELHMECPDAFAAYRKLREQNPSPYMFYVRGVSERGAYELFGASPESNLKYTAATNVVELYPIAGTRPRGLNPDGSVNHELDIRAELELRTDAKEIAEHTMLVDLARNDLARVAKPATRQVSDLLQVDRYSRVMHLVSRVVAELAEDLDALDAYRACMNMGTLTGAPKLKAMELLRDMEQTRRGSYGGAVGYLRGGGDMDTCIVIRSAFVRDGKAIVQAGAGVVRDSNPQSEADETVHKAYAVLSAIAAANNARLEILR